MRVYQVVTTLGYGDAVGNEILALLRGLKQAGYETKVYAEAIDERISLTDVDNIQNMKDIKREDVILYHLATGTELNFKIAEYPARKILCYHNITPPHFFRPFNEQAALNCRSGLDGVAFLKDKVDYCLVASAFSQSDLKRMGYQCKMDILPIMIRFDDYSALPDAQVLQQLRDGHENILFVGRICPNKKQEDIIAAYALYKRYYNSNARLILAGSYHGMEDYYQCLKAYVEENAIQDVVFTGHIRFEELLAYYTSADSFVCMSEHEGFCVPLVEAMYFGIPIIAYDSTAVGETLNGAGILLKSKEPLHTAAWLHRIHMDKKLRAQILQNQKERLQDFSEEKILNDFKKYMEAFIGA